MSFLQLMLWLLLQEMKQACKYLCKVFGFEKSTVRNFLICLYYFTHIFIPLEFVRSKSLLHSSIYILYVQERELIKYMKEYDADGDGTLDFGEFQTAMRFAQHKKDNQIHKDEVDVWE